MGKIGKIRKNGKQIFPKTVTKAVKDVGSGKMLDEILEQQREEVNSKALRAAVVLYIGGDVAVAEKNGKLAVKADDLVVETEQGTVSLKNKANVSDFVPVSNREIKEMFEKEGYIPGSQEESPWEWDTATDMDIDNLSDEEDTDEPDHDVSDEEGARD